MSLIELLGMCRCKAKFDRVFTVEAHTRATSLNRMGFLCKDVSIKEIISTTWNLLVLKKNFGIFSNTDIFCFNFKVLDEKLTTPVPRAKEGITISFSDNFEKKLNNLSLER